MRQWLGILTTVVIVKDGETSHYTYIYEISTNFWWIGEKQWITYPGLSLSLSLSLIALLYWSSLYHFNWIEYDLIFEFILRGHSFNFLATHIICVAPFCCVQDERPTSNNTWDIISVQFWPYLGVAVIQIHEFWNRNYEAKIKKK